MKNGRESFEGMAKFCAILVQCNKCKHPLGQFRGERLRTSGEK